MSSGSKHGWLHMHPDARCLPRISAGNAQEPCSDWLLMPLMVIMFSCPILLCCPTITSFEHASPNSPPADCPTSIDDRSTRRRLCFALPISRLRVASLSLLLTTTTNSARRDFFAVCRPRLLLDLDTINALTIEPLALSQRRYFKL